MERPRGQLGGELHEVIGTHRDHDHPVEAAPPENGARELQRPLPGNLSLHRVADVENVFSRRLLVHGEMAALAEVDPRFRLLQIGENQDSVAVDDPHLMGNVVDVFFLPAPDVGGQLSRRIHPGIACVEQQFVDPLHAGPAEFGKHLGLDRRLGFRFAQIAVPGADQVVGNQPPRQCQQRAGHQYYADFHLRPGIRHFVNDGSSPGVLSGHDSQRAGKSKSSGGRKGG